MHVIGVMSGTSLDGLDLANCHFVPGDPWRFALLHTTTIPYTDYWQKRLASIADEKGVRLVQADFEYGKYIGDEVNRFIKEHQINPDLIASHGHTIFHQPEKGFTKQIGNGHAIAAVTRLPVVYDFRTLDVMLGGQGAPLVPVGDKYLFGEYKYCLNLGGFGNVSFDHTKHGRIAFDICPVNIVLNYLAGLAGMSYDNRGIMASNGKTDADLLAKLDSLEYYQKAYPKSLGREWVEINIFPLLNNAGFSVEDKLQTFTTHLSGQIARAIEMAGPGKVLVTGGGAFNDYLIQSIKQKTRSELIIPDGNTVNFKEALIFALLGLLRIRNEVNCFSSVTGARSDSVCGLLVTPPLWL